MVLDHKNTSGDPAGINGGMYYSENTNKFRCYEQSTWVDCITKPLISRFYISSNQTIATGSDTKVNFPATEFNEAGVTVTGSNTFTIPKSGIWQLNTSVLMNSNGNQGERYIAIVNADNIPNVRYSHSNVYPAGSGLGSLSTSTTQRFTAGTNIAVIVYQSSGLNLSAISAWSTGSNFTMTWIGN